MRGPIQNYRFGKMEHREREARVSRYWDRDVGNKASITIGERIRLSFDRPSKGLQRLWCATARVGLSPAGC